MAVCGAIFAHQLHAVAGNPSADVYRHAIALTFAAGVCVVAMALAAVLFLPELPLRQHNESVAPAG